MTTEYICVDASFVVRLVNSNSSESPWIRLWEEWLEAGTEIISPTLLYYEVTNAIYRMGQAGQLQEDEVKTALEDAMNLGIQLKSDSQLHLLAVTLAKRFNFPATYDSHYLALAQQYKAEFYTGDKRLFKKVQGQFSGIFLVEGKS
ncbi:MAG: type II toxin-antitoxin system VapC family toxin [Oscillatoria sp. PMC 1051.18]|nr:type II toxin-antitoxin system VapC family toxin [Oscillatoria sp. PMC 1050.18]MEC5033096.1 type II toxin-antitoxin system VapC family toxin [Oscillatoria sp. PMC 1051.18]